MDILAPIRVFDRFQQRHRWLALPMAVVKKFADDQGGSLAALMAYYGFFSLFPLLLVLATILGFVLQGDVHAQQSVENSVLGQFPVIGHSIQTHALTGRVSALVIGLLTSTLAGLGVTNAAQQALDRVWAVPFKERPDFVHRRLRGLGLIAVLGAIFLASTVISGRVSAVGGPAAKVAGIALSLLLNFVLFLAAFRFLTAGVVATRCLRISVVVAGIFWEILQVGGGLYIQHYLRHASETYGYFASVIALLVFLHLGAQLTIYAAEVNVVVTRKLWPRSLLGPPTKPADEDALVALAKVEERHDNERVEVEFDPDQVRSQKS